VWVRLSAVSSTFAGNTGGLGGWTGGLVSFGDSPLAAQLTNCVLWGNLQAGAPSDLLSTGPSVPSTSVSADTCDVGVSAGPVTGTNILSVDPLFVNLAAGDVHLTANSPCRDKGIARASLPVFDYEGDPRITGIATDIGADEFDGLPGSREALALQSTVNAAFPPSLILANPIAGDVASVTVTSPGGSFANELTVLFSDVWFPPTMPVAPFPDVQVSLGAAVATVWGSGVGTGRTFSAIIPPGLGGLALRMQAFCLTPAAKNGAFAARSPRSSDRRSS
jgi:hypothetical protein